MNFKNTRLSWRRPIASYSKVRWVIGALARNQAALLDRARISGKEYLDIGCGPNVHDGFTNLDYDWHPKIDMCWDVTKGLPLPDRAVKGIFSEHCFEHLRFEAIGFVLEECQRVLTGC